jgi:hypothetical protein
VSQEPSATRYWLSSLIRQVAFYSGQLLANWPIRILLLLWWGMAVIGILMAAGIFSTDEFSDEYISSAGLIRQERELKFAGLILATPVPSTVSYLAKLVSCLTIPLVMLLLMLGSCLLYQVILTDSGIAWYLYAVSSYYFLLPTLNQTVLIFYILTLIAQKPLPTSIWRWRSVRVC